MTWQQLKEILKSNREELENEKNVKIVQCPECSFPLRENNHGDLLCPICGWRGTQRR